MRVIDLGRFVDRRAAPWPVGVVRAIIGAAAVLKAIEIAPLLARFGDPGVVRVPYLEWLPTVAALSSPLVTIAWLSAGLAFAMGAWVRLSGSVLTGIFAVVLLSDQQLYSNHLYLLILFTGLLTVARSDAAFSVLPRHADAGDTIPAWPLDLVKLQLSIVYLFAGLSKINVTFLSGTVVALALRRSGPLAVPDDWRTFEVMATLSMLAVLIELFLAVALWIPRWRRTAFVFGFLMHAGITIWLEPPAQLAIFSLIILAPYLLFLDAPPRAAVLVWDDSCSFCAGWVRWFGRLDWLRTLRLQPSSDVRALAELGMEREQADRAMQLIARDHRTEGFDAVVRVLEQLPLTFLWAPLLRLPPITWLGRRIYRRVAARRRCEIVPAR